MAIPKGYRLLTAEDIGKVFGVDLETTLYIDTDVEISNESYFIQGKTTDLTNFMQASKLYDSGYEFYMSRISWSSITTGGMETDLAWEGSLGWVNTQESPIIADTGLEITSFNTDYNWNTWFYVKDKADPKEQFITDMNGLAESIVGKAGSSGKKTIKEMKTLVDGLKTEFITQEKTVTPTKSSQAITPDSGKDGLSKVTVNAIPSNYIVPSGSLNITENGTHDVTDKASVVVNVPGVVAEQWDGAYEEIVNGFTLTLNCDSEVVGSEYYMYSLDSGSTWLQFTSAEMVLENITKIMFQGGVGHSAMAVGTTSGGKDIAGLCESETDDITLTQDTTWYVSEYYTGVGGAD